MNQQVTFRVGRGPRPKSRAPRPETPLTLALHFFTSLAWLGLGLAAIILTIGVNQYTPH
jgi:hypothetical protein